MSVDTWRERRADQAKRRTLFRGLARVRSDSTPTAPVTLANRPLPCCVAILENGGAPRTMPRDETYSRPEPFIADMLALHDGKFLAHRNAVFDAADCRGQMAARALLRTVSHLYVPRERRAGPFHLQLTDLHVSNILVDDDWNITCLLDLEWICSLPAEMLAVPYWLTGRSIHELVGDDLSRFDLVCREFMDMLEEEEVAMTGGSQSVLARIMHESWESGAVWFWRCLTSVDALFHLVEDHVSPRYCPFSSKVEQVLSEYWCQDSAAVVRSKVADNEKYEEELRSLFGKPD
ncbi:hypothetical protein N658DRAFT_519323 [Parathielavia hyrcaniae]|uniref:Aminoglycoside phosphotransferase domain-containing protein n=1 Tax=Parathielavia hyrcaniae TaxID=113614 RepID=A0AAN6PQT1_9PEZI|nr:hypothetical protein N658DRAFT_519323 [Parathielavia hyrcaniae]